MLRVHILFAGSSCLVRTFDKGAGRPELGRWGSHGPRRLSKLARDRSLADQRLIAPLAPMADVE